MGIRIRNNGQGGRITFRSLGLGGHITSGWPVTSTGLLLDTYSGAAAAYSLRKLNTSYSGSAIRVRRSSDNSEQDIGFVNGQLDTSSLLTFVGGGNGFVTTWYDQSTGGVNSTQTTSANQPQIVTSGVVNIQGTKPTLTFNGTTQFLTRSDTGLPIGDAAYVTVTRTFSNPTTYYVHLSYGTTSANANVSLLYGPTLNSNAQTVIGVTNYGASVGLPGRSPNLYNLQFVAKPSAPNQTWAQYINNSSSSTVSMQALTTLSGTFTLGSGLGYFFGGNMQEVIIYPDKQISGRLGIETNINTYYSIY